MRVLLSNHKAFQSASRLETVATKYNIKIVFCPKYHCELNPIEGLWCNQKRYVRSRTDQTYSTMLKLIDDSRHHFIKKNLNIKLWRRFWNSLQMYNDGKSYGDVLKLFFSQSCKEEIQSHRVIYNSSLI